MRRSGERLTEALRCVLESGQVSDPLCTVCAELARHVKRFDRRLADVQKTVRYGGEREWPWNRLEAKGRFAKAAQVKSVAEELRKEGWREHALLPVCIRAFDGRAEGYRSARDLYDYCRAKHNLEELKDYAVN